MINNLNINPELCSKCKGKGWCGKKCPIISKFSEFKPRLKKHFSGSSPPEIFVGRYGYPDVNTGILSPQEYGNTEDYAFPELWHQKNFDIEKIMDLRSKLVYGRFRRNVKSPGNRFSDLFKEISMADRHVNTEIFLKKVPNQNLNINKEMPIIGNPAPLQKARLEGNPHINKKVDYLVNDTDVKSVDAILELYKKVEVSNIMKILSAGLLGKKKNRKLVPTRWSIVATDDTISKFLLNKIRFYQEISCIEVFHSEYLGNHYEFLLLPDKFSFEVIEAKIPGSVWNPSLSSSVYLAIDYESFNGRKSYASDVTGAYYANRLALTEYLEKRKKQASCLVMRECRPEYYAPCGVGILREASRQAFKNEPEKFFSINEALLYIKKRLKLNIDVFKNNSWLLKEYGRQKRLSEF